MLLVHMVPPGSSGPGREEPWCGSRAETKTRGATVRCDSPHPHGWWSGQRDHRTAQDGGEPLPPRVRKPHPWMQGLLGKVVLRPRTPPPLRAGRSLVQWMSPQASASVSPPENGMTQQPHLAGLL